MSERLEVAEVARLGEAVLTEVGTVVVGMRTAPCGPRWPRSWPAATCCSRTCPGWARRWPPAAWPPPSGWSSGGCSAPRTCCRPTSPAPTSSTRPRPRSSFRPGPGVHRAAAGRRDQPDRAEDPVRAAGGDGRAAGHRRGRAVFVLDPPFHVMATSNPVEYEGTYPLPEAQLDRFMVRLAVGYPEPAAEADVLLRRLDRRTEEATVDAVVDAATVLRMQAGVEAVDRRPRHRRLLRRPGRRAPGAHPASRSAPPRAARWRCCWSPGRSRGAGRPGLRHCPEDVKEIAVSALAHRITLNPQTWATGLQAADVVATLLDQVAGPGRRRSGRRRPRR